ncbi:hypothetical protein EZ313_06290 [Ramlibacter henchirensis]|uniref:DUF883 domain-containing protein n=1 Tax=Ramlibacter henchirensis TaxID=204072 RepID=A0A4Z0C705_9BURK|nr:hypothetical protein [Ramlibacter henchirensis]TFZ06250.1 hypothetical protein EZ313_06290 [Ramlibacter henchirensis]
MNSETSSSNPFPTSSSTSSTSTGGSNAGGMGADSGTVQRLAQRAHEAVDRLEQTVSTGSERMIGWQQEYGDMAREQVRTNPLAAVGVAFAVGIIFSKLFMR